MAARKASAGQRRKAAATPGPTGILVLGMHRSGTSALTRVLNLLGMALGDRMIPAQPGVNETGFWEHEDVVRLHDRILDWHGRAWHDIRGLPPADADQQRVFVREARGIIGRDFGGASAWAIKDPRLSLLVPVWREAIEASGMEGACIHVIRHPDEVAASLARRDGLTTGHALLLWGMYVCSGLRGSEGARRAVVDYAWLLSDWRAELRRIGEALGIDWEEAIATEGSRVDAFLDEGLRRQRNGREPSVGDDALTASVFALYAAMRAVATPGGDWSAVREAAAAFERVAADLVPHMHDLLEHVYMHGARADNAERLVAAGLNDKGEFLEAVRQALAGPDSLLDRVSTLDRSIADAIVQVTSGSSSRIEALTRILEEKEQRLRDGAVLLQEREQRLREAAEQRRERESWLEELRRHADGLEQMRTGLEQQVSALEQERAAATASASEAAARLEAASLLVGEKEQRLKDASARREALEQQLRTLQATNESLRSERDGLAEAVESAGQESVRLRSDLAEAQARLRDVGARLATRDAQLAEALGSNSWRITAPLRWVRNRIDSIRKGTPAAGYRAMLGQRTVRSTPRDVAELPVPAPAGSQSEPRDAYLAALFASQHEPRSPHYVPATDAPPPSPGDLRAKAIAFYLPQFHPVAENDSWWGRGFTEWTNVTRAQPQFIGHDQPQLPADLGFYDLRLPEVIRHQAELARQYGIHGFCFHYYWFAGHRLLERPLDLFLANRDIDFPFCLCWANENWTRRWDGQDSEILMAQDHSPENDLAFIRDLEPYLRDPRYIRVDGKPLVIVYRPSILPDCAATLERWRQHCRDAGIGELFLGMVQFDVVDPRRYGFDAAFEFPPHKLAAGLDPINDSLDIVNPEYRGHVVHYQSIVDGAREWPKPDYPMVRGVFPGWDNEARRPGKGYTFAFGTPERYRGWLEQAIAYAEAHPVGGEQLVMVNAWNEWAEGAHLEPDRRHGHAFLAATRQALERRAGAAPALAPPRPRTVVVSHDAHPHGAQYLALHLVRALHREFGHDVDVVLLGEGRLEPEFRACATVHQAASIAGDPAALGELAARLWSGGARTAIANTTVSGMFAGALKHCGFHVVSLVHELPGLIRDYGLEAHAATIAREADAVVFAAEVVREGFAQVAPLDRSRAIVRPQGLFTRSRYLGMDDLAEPRRRLRARLGLPAEAKVVLAVGYGDRRKGLDIFGDVAARLSPRDPDLHFVWVGHHDEAMMDAVRMQLRQAGAGDRFHAPGLDFDTDDYYAGADVYALTSREDPFPSVVLEAMSVGLPVVAFGGSGGAAALLSRGAGRVVDEGSAQAFGEAVVDLLGDAGARLACARSGRALVAREFGFRQYVFDLLALADAAPPRVSVIVPNYNYGALLAGRLQSVAGQTLPPYEIIVLDDASTDDSLEVLAGLRASLGTEFQVVPADANSGSVFRQWLRGIEMARGEYVWIAEADDLSDPEFLAEVTRALREDPSVVMSYCQSRAIDEQGRVLSEDYLSWTNDLDETRWLAPFVATGAQEVEAGLGVKNTIPNVSAVVFRRDALLDVLRPAIDEIANYRIAGDWATYLRLLERGRIAYSPRSLNAHRRHDRSVTSGGSRLPHLLEVARVQREAGKRYGCAEACGSRARQYLQALYEEFGLAGEDAPRVEMNRQLQAVLQ